MESLQSPGNFNLPTYNDNNVFPPKFTSYPSTVPRKTTLTPPTPLPQPNIHPPKRGQLVRKTTPPVPPVTLRPSTRDGMWSP